MEKLYGGYGENSGSGMRAGHQDKIFEGGNAYMDKEFPKLDRLIRAAIIPDKSVLLTPLKLENESRTTQLEGKTFGSGIFPSLHNSFQK